MSWDCSIFGLGRPLSYRDRVLRSHHGLIRDQLHAGTDGCAVAIAGAQSANVSERREPERKGIGKSFRVTPTTPGCRDTVHAANPQFAAETSLA